MRDYTIKKEILNSGRERCTPLVRTVKEKKLPKWLRWIHVPVWIYESPWQRIVCVDGIYTVMEPTWECEMTYEEALNHVNGYKAEMDRSISHAVKEIRFIKII